ncbi:MAG: hypothetical protein CMJ40_00950 [Phycisphaerae bacterium]|nr:hypothetical protein [Phycisphaerae bacterium]
MESTSMMHALVIIDNLRRSQEEQAIRDVLVGLQNAGIQITEMVQSPESSHDEISPLATEAPLHTPMPLNWLQRRRIIDGLSREIGRSLPDVIITFGQFAASIGQDLAMSLELPLVVECWQTDHIKRPPLRPQIVSAYATASSGLANAMRERDQHHLVATTPHPITMTDTANDTTNLPPSIAILDAEVDARSTRDILDGLTETVKHHPDLQIFMELGKSRSNTTWRHAESLGLLDRISSFSNASVLRPLISDCTFLIIANSTCCTRSVIDEAMSKGRVILRPDHPMLASPDRRHQCILTESSKEAWAEAIEDLISDSDRRSRLGQQARTHVRQQNDPNRVFSTWTQLIHEVSSELSYPLGNAGSTTL